MSPVDVVVIGGGVIGASVAYHLAARGCSRVLVLDSSHQLGQGSTGKATGGFRAQFGSAVNVQLSLLSREKLRHFPDELGVDSGYRRSGYLFLARDADQLAALLAAQQVQHAAGLHEARQVTRAEIQQLNPAVNCEGLVGGVFCPTDGFIRPLEILRGYTEGAQRLGVQVSFAQPCEGFRMNGERIAVVRTPAGEIAAGIVVNAAGAWAAAVAEYAGVRIPITPLRRQVAATYPGSWLPDAMPMTIFVEDGFHLRVREGRVLLLWPDRPRGADGFDTTFDDAWLEPVLWRARERVPCLAHALVDRASCWAGLYEMSPDKHALLGPAPGVENLYLANGSSGHGVMHAPALGQLLAEMILDGGATTLDTHALRPSRFAEGQPNTGAALL